jgi:hypothetical protein
VLHNLAKDMGVLVEDTDFASFDMLKELETARNCLHLKQINQSKPNSCVEFVPCEDHIINIVSSDEDSDIGEMLFQQSKEKSKFGRKKRFGFSPGGGTKTTKILACQFLEI